MFFILYGTQKKYGAIEEMWRLNYVPIQREK
jgi:hypothetical protein